MAMKILLVSLLGGVLGLDRIVMQAMLSRPIVSAPLVGLALGDVYTGLLAGALFELFWIDRLPVGTCIPPNDFLAALLAASASIIVGQELGHASRELVAFSFLLFIPFGFLGQSVDSLIIGSNDALSEGARQDAERAEAGGIFRKQMAGLTKTFFAYVSLIFLSLFSGATVLLLIFPLLPSAILRALSLSYFFLPVLGVAAGLNTVNLKGAVPIFCALFLVITLILELLHV
ncbi:MAG TPA: PTS sugar transporter subunit IIC [Syntrophales bacterium]|nr:PTS sugar transporter subunit IIC [Syntrophales bacterium]